MEVQHERAGSAERFVDALRGAQAGVWEWSLETDLLTWSPEMGELTGIPSEESTRERLFEIIHPDDRANLYHATVRAVDVTSEMAVEVRLIRPDGSLRWIEIRAQVVRENGKPVRLVGLGQDVTERRKAEARYQHATDLVPCIVWIADPSGRTHHVNDRWAESIGRPFNFASENAWEEITHSDDFEAARKVWRRSLAEAIPYEQHVRYRTANGTYRWFFERAEPLFDDEGRVVEWFGTSIDVHDRTVAEMDTRRLIDSMPQIAWAVSVTGEVDFLNQQYLDYCGLGPDARGEKGWRDVVHPEDRNFAAEYAACVAGRRPWVQELRLRRYDGVYRWHLSRLVPIFDSDDNIVRWFGTSTDIHEQKTKEESLRFLVHVTEATRTDSEPESIMATTLRMLGEHLGATRGTYTEVDTHQEISRVIQDWGPNLPSLKGTHRRSEFGEVLKATLEAGRTAVVRDLGTDIDSEAAREAFRRIGVESMIACPLIKDNRLVATFCVFSDRPRAWTGDEIERVEMVADRSWSNVERARSERALRELNLDLERRVAERTRELLEANREMEGFTYTVAHDLRAPLRAITATSMMLLNDAPAKLSAEESALLQRQAHNAKRLGLLIDDLLKLSRLSREEMHSSSFNLTSLAQEVVDELVADGRATHIHFHITPDMAAFGDPRLIRFVLLNLLENACKFTPPLGEPGSVRVGKRGDAFFVADRGIGFDPQYMDRLFRPFERLVTEAEFPGTGIGLANVKRIVERHGGSVWADSEPGHGATFWFTLGSPGEAI